MTKNRQTEHSDITEAIRRIERMEQCFDTLLTTARTDARAIYHSSQLSTLLTQLLRYYEGGQWLHDYEMDEQGILPPHLKRGVLSQDAVFDFLSMLSPLQNDTEPHGDP